MCIIQHNAIIEVIECQRTQFIKITLQSFGAAV